ncbi:MAG: hypothetical protein KDA89_23230, partial [Planctomycetaceae bacterium]|nr:hypothetical protein [Planctomycetaceae bacterium]
MTSLRFVGDVPVWIGLLLAALAAGLSWRYYRRESFDLPANLRWLLPALRSLAFVLALLLLTGPVLHHRKVIGEPGRVKIYVDASQSMDLVDRHLTDERKLLIAQSHGWLERGRIDSRLHQLANQIHDVRERTLLELRAEQVSADDIMKLRDDLLEVLNSATEVANEFPESEQHDSADDESNGMQSISLLQAIVRPANQNATEADMAQLLAACETTRSVEDRIRQTFRREVRNLVDSGDASVKAALAMADETTRWRRCEQLLLEGSKALFDNLKRFHNVEVFALHNQQAVLMLDSQITAEVPREFSEIADAPVSDLISGITATQTSSVSRSSVGNDGGAVEFAGRTTAVVLLTDGQHNAGPSPLPTARILGGQGIAFFHVAMGADVAAPDLSVTGLEHPQLVFRKGRVRGSITIQDRMPAGQPTVVQIEHDGDVLWEQQLLTDGSGERRIAFEFGIEEIVQRLSDRLAGEVRQHSLPLAMT